MEKSDNTHQNTVTEKELYQVSGGVNDITPNEFYQNGNEIDLLNTDYLPKEIKTILNDQEKN